jgi:hypothetical protein
MASSIPLSEEAITSITFTIGIALFLNRQKIACHAGCIFCGSVILTKKRYDEKASLFDGPCRLLNGEGTG